jgi:hypothetical protein
MAGGRIVCRSAQDAPFSLAQRTNGRHHLIPQAAGWRCAPPGRPSNRTPPSWEHTHTTGDPITAIVKVAEQEGLLLEDVLTKLCADMLSRHLRPGRRKRVLKQKKNQGSRRRRSARIAHIKRQGRRPLDAFCYHSKLSSSGLGP